MSLLDSHLEQISLSSSAIAELPFPSPRIFTNALLGSHDITALIRDTEAHERALFQVDPTSKPHASRRATRRTTTFAAEPEKESMASRIYSARNNRNQSAVARVLGSDMMEEIKKSAGTSSRGPRGEVNIEVLLRGAEILCNVYPVVGAQDKIATLRYRHEIIAKSIADLEDRVAANTAELEQMRNSYDDEDKYDIPMPAAAPDADVTDEDIERELAEIRELERRKRKLEERVTGMDRDLGGLMETLIVRPELRRLRLICPEIPYVFTVKKQYGWVAGPGSAAHGAASAALQLDSNRSSTETAASTEQQKSQHTQLVRSLWEALNNRDPQSTEYSTAHMKLSQLSQNLMKGMRLFQQSRQQALQQQQAQQQQAQQQQVQAQAQGPPVQRTQSNNPQNLTQLLPQIQQKVQGLNFFLPPNVTPEQIQSWIPEARLRYGIALQKQEVGRARIADLRQQFSQRQSQGGMSQEEVTEFKNRQMAAEKLFREGSDFLNKFKDQQETFKAQGQQTSQMAQPAQNANANPAQTTASGPAAGGAAQGNNQAAGGASASMANAPTPAPHTINSAVNAARNQAGQTAMSPSTSQPGQPAAPHRHHSKEPQGAQATFNQTPTADGSAATPTTQAMNQGPPRPLSQQAAMAQAANYNTNQNQQQPQGVNQGANGQSGHPTGYLANRPTETSTRQINMAIPTKLNVSTPEPVPMSAARPTLSGGPSHGAMGMMGQPAIQKHPGYVLEGEGQHVLSKKMLDILVRQVTGGGEGEMLTPDAEEFVLQMADDFVDDVITQACRLAKLRPSSTLDIRDIQLVLERNYNMLKKPQPTQGWLQKMSAVQAAKVTQGRSE
ncbi:hypothetical protein N7468_009061 [Penicillium chermesinum]|uniref:DASH complex subunit SPC34 n=1 Tax=Penicillium chermesinum TaxID=63820 RepID=A0A9W9TEH7_9EURO|nr:uncharacterized protein N7468_009061 [Penicillium chermesinum]KAJ5219857.1 hypothetical protein N7468_009061 [Penicillium chermesinum]